MRFRICCTENDPAIGFAGRELKKYLLLMDGASTFPTEAATGETDYRILLRTDQQETSDPHPAPQDAKSAALAAAQDDRYHISADGGQAVLTGSNPLSVLLAAYRFLTEAGCRFLGPGSEYVPQARIQDLHLDICEEASYRHRGVCIEGADSVENILDFIDWLPKAGFNTFFLQHKNPDAFLNLWYGHKFNPLLESRSLTEEERDGAMDRIRKAMALRGIHYHGVGHGWTAEVLRFDAPCVKASAGPAEDIRPMVAMIGGQREYYEGIPSNTNLCYSNKEAITDFADRVVSYALLHPEVTYIHVWLADEYNNVCECDECRKSTLSDQYIHILNRIDEKLAEQHSPAKIVMLLYQELLWPPRTERLHNQDRFLLMFAPISRTFEASYDQKEESAGLPPYRRNQIKLPNSLEENLAFLEAWQEVCPGLDSFVYDYPLGRAHYGDFGYIHIADIIDKDIKALNCLKLNGYISCQELRASFPHSFPNYVMGKMLWNKDLDFKEVEEEYFSAAYGPDWKKALAHLQKLSDLSSCDYFNGIGSRTNPGMAKRYRMIAEYAQQELDEVHRLAENSAGTAQTYWQRLDYHSTYCILLSKALSSLAEGDTEKAQQLWLDFAGLIRSHELEYQKYLDVYRVIEVATKYTGFKLDI